MESGEAMSPPKFQSKTWSRCTTYIAARAAELNVEVDLTPNHSNAADLERLWLGCLEFDANNEAYDKQLLQALCDSLLDASIVTTLQGVRHAEPSSMEEYQRLFNHQLPRLEMCDCVWTPPKPIQLTVSWSVEADDKSVLRPLPGAQLRLPFMEGK